MKYFAFLSLILMGCSQVTHHTSKDVHVQSHLYEFPHKKYSKLVVGGFSGLNFLKREGHDLIFWTHTDRGPNAESYHDPKGNLMVRPFVLPDFNPHIVKFKFDTQTKTIHYLEELPLTLPDGTPLTGISNHLPQKGRTGDEYPVTISGESIKHDLMGIDPEGICFQGKHVWMVEEYGPSILKFDQTGKLITRFVPKNYYEEKDLKELQKKYGKEIIKSNLPIELLTRKLNRGFEGIACTQDKIYAILQSPLPTQKKSVFIFEFDTKKDEMTNTFNYRMEREDVDKIGDLTYFNDKLYIIEQNSDIGEKGIHRVYEVAIEEDTLHKKLYLDLVKSGFDFASKIEGLTFDQDGTLYVINDNDFGLTGAIDEKAMWPVVDSNNKSVLGIFKKK